MGTLPAVIDKRTQRKPYDTPWFRKMRGRPRIYTQEIADEIIDRVAHGEPVYQVCLDEHMPSRTTVYDWQDHPDYRDFTNRLKAAQNRQLSTWEEQTNQIAEDRTLDLISTEVVLNDEEGGERRIVKVTPNAVAVARDKLRIDTKLKLLAARRTEIFGHKLATQVVHKVEHAIDLSRVPTDALALLADALRYVKDVQGQTIEGEVEDDE